MGQGVNTKLMQVAAHAFSVDISRIKLETTNTTRVANTSPTAASSGADLNGKALQIACNEIRERLITEAAKILDIPHDKVNIRDEQVYDSDKKTGLGWEELIDKAFLDRIKLSEVGHYSTPVIHFDKTKEKGHPFTYHVYGAALTTITLDCIRGTYETDSVQIIHDFGNSLNLTIDKGQVEGAVVQGVGWMTLEELTYDKKGHLLADSLSKYKIPDVYAAPKVIDTIPLETDGPELAIMKSKAVGEPPFMYGIGAYFALRNAVREFNPETTLEYDAPLTPEKVLLGLYTKKK
jgi:xanthine dehydrogenase large subunit